jgi:hypothetical protein
MSAGLDMSSKRAEKKEFEEFKEFKDSRRGARSQEVLGTPNGGSESTVYESNLLSNQS